MALGENGACGCDDDHRILYSLCLCIYILSSVCINSSYIQTRKDDIIVTHFYVLIISKYLSATMHVKNE